MSSSKKGSSLARGKAFHDVLAYFRALSKRDEFLKAAYDGLVQEDPTIVKGVASIYDLRRHWRRVAPKA